MSQQSSTKEKILSAARKVFAESGFNGATTARIAKTAGISEGAIYRHFDNKEELLMECVKPAFQKILESMEKEKLEADNLREFIYKSLEMRLKIYEENYETFKIIFNEIPHSKKMTNQFMTFLSKQDKRISKLLSKVKDLGGFKRSRNYLVYGMGQVMALWMLLNLKEWEGTDDISFSEEMMNISEEHVLEDLTDYIMYGIAGVPENFGS